MNVDHLPDKARVWIYQADRVLNEAEQLGIAKAMDGFVQQWKAHGAELAAGYEIREGRWLILAVDEQAQAATGCSIDSSVHVIRELGDRYRLDFFNRTLVVYEHEGERRTAPMHQFWALRKAGIVNEHTYVYNTIATTLGELRTSWKQKFEDSWHQEAWR